MFPYHRPPRFRQRPRSIFLPPRPPSSNIHPFISSFKKEDGQWDFDKISKSIQNANKMIGQLQPIVQQFSSFIKRK